MAIRDTQLATLIAVLTYFLVGCAVTTNLGEGGNSIPENWFLAVAQVPEGCVSIDGNYQTFGVGKFIESEELTQARLDAVLGHAYPSEKVPERVSISLGREVNMLNIQFGHPVNRSFSIATNCINGWYTSEIETTNEYLGDGATLDYLSRNIKLGKTIDGDLVVHLVLDGQFSSFLVLKSRDIRESWSKYEQLKSKTH